MVSSIINMQNSRVMTKIFNFISTTSYIRSYWEYCFYYKYWK